MQLNFVEEKNSCRSRSRSIKVYFSIISRSTKSQKQRFEKSLRLGFWDCIKIHLQGHWVLRYIKNWCQALCVDPQQPRSITLDLLDVRPYNITLSGHDGIL